MAEDRDHDLFGNARFRFDPRQPRAVRLISGPAAADPRGIDMLAAIGLEIRDRRIGAAARLVLVQFDDAGIGR